MSKQQMKIKKHWKNKEKRRVVHLVSLVVLLLEFVLCRFAFFSFHGMKEWPLVLFLVGIVVLVFSMFHKKNYNYVPVFTVIGYFVGFWAGVLFSSKGQDAGGGATNNFWILWTVVFVGCILAGVITETARKWWKLTRPCTIMKEKEE